MKCWVGGRDGVLQVDSVFQRAGGLLQERWTANRKALCPAGFAYEAVGGGLALDV